MSTDLEFCQDLPKIRLSPIPIQTPEPSEAPKPDAARISIIQRLNNNDSRSSCDNNNNNNKDKDEDEDEEENECRTPTSAEHRIPEILSCPGAPRKPARAPSCKRKLSELEFFEVVNRDEVERFFRSSFAKASSAKRSCCPCK